MDGNKHTVDSYDNSLHNYKEPLGATRDLGESEEALPIDQEGDYEVLELNIALSESDLESARK